MTIKDRVGLGWRPEIGLEILERLDSVDILEITAENYAHLGTSDLQSYRRLGSQISIVVHAVSLGMASTYPVSMKHVDAVARVVDAIRPEAWSEHLAFVRTPHQELGHLAAPPWSEETIEGALVNIRSAARIAGSVPHLENIATLYLPPGSTLSEPEWTTRIIRGAETKLLIDLENIYANSRNFKTDCMAELLKFPLDDVEYVHIAGGHETHDQDGSFFLDDHLHPVAAEVFTMLEELGARVSQPLTVILERDGNYPNFEETNGELLKARAALAAGRKRQEFRHAV